MHRLSLWLRNYTVRATLAESGELWRGLARVKMERVKGILSCIYAPIFKSNFKTVLLRYPQEYPKKERLHKWDSRRHVDES